MCARSWITLLGTGLLALACKGPGNIGEDDDRAVKPGVDDEVEDCIPTSCAAAGKDCGTMPDGCGGSVACGSCGQGQTCGAGGNANVCGIGTCTTTNCAAEGKDCGVISDGCSEVLACGSCTQPRFCGGGGEENVCGEDALATGSGCGGVFNPDQVLDLHLTLTDADWTALKADLTNSVYFPARFRCNDEAPLPFEVGIRRKRSGSTVKPGLKIDFNRLQKGGAWHSLKKLSLENGISEGSGSASTEDVVAEYLAWRLMVLSGAYSGRAAFVRFFINGAPVGTYTNVEQVDKRFLRSRLGDDSGWLYKHSGSAGDGQKTNLGQPNPFEAYFCFWKTGTRCPPPADLQSSLPQRLHIDQMLRFGGVNALLGNADAPLVKQNNYYYYDSVGAARVYIPWDLDTLMNTKVSFFGGPGGVGGGTTVYTDVLFAHWAGDYDGLMTSLLQGPLQLANIHAELDRVGAVAASALDSDPATSGNTAATVASLKTWWSGRHATMKAELDAHAP